MGGQAGGFRVDLHALEQAERGVRDAVAELNELAGTGGGEAGKGQDGRGLAEYLRSGELSPTSVGHGDLAGAIVGFVDGWEWGVKFLVEDGVACADALGDTRSDYQKAQDAAADGLKRVLHMMAGNPMEAATAWDDHSAGQVVDELLPDWTPESTAESMQRSVGQVEGLTGWDVTGDGHTGATAPAGGR